MKRHATSNARWIREDRLPTLEEIRWLESEEGRAACQAMAAGEPADTPAAIAHWRERLSPARVSAAWTQILLRRAATAKFSRAQEMLFDRIGLEQSTDEVIAAHKARRFAGLGRIADLCCGIGGDTLALASEHEVIAVDRAAVRTAIAAHNAAVYGHPVATSTADVSLDCPPADAAHIDPDRRPAGRRSHTVDASSPGLTTLERIVAHYKHVAIKLSPGADFDALPFPAEIELISHHGECKQAVAWTGNFVQAHRRATVLVDRQPPVSGGRASRPPSEGQAFRASCGEPASHPSSPPLSRGKPVSHPPFPPLDKGGQGGVEGGRDARPPGYSPELSCTRFEAVQMVAMPGQSLDWPAVRPPAPGHYLYEPDPAVIRAHLVGILAAKLDLAPVDARIAWLVGDRPIDDPLIRAFRVIAVQPWSAKSARPWLAQHDIGPLEVKTRGFAAHPETILKQLHPPGTRPAVLFLTRLGDHPTAILAERQYGVARNGTVSEPLSRRGPQHTTCG